jgi:predicted negative regulator of RcsB-dependent stress response
MPEQRAATLAELTAVRRLLEGLDRKLGDPVKGPVPRDEFKRWLRRNLALVIAVVLLVGGALVWNRVTLQQAQRQSERDIRTVLTTCRAANTLTRQQIAYCERRIPGFTVGRDATRRAAAMTLRNQTRLEKLESQVAKLEGRR